MTNSTRDYNTFVRANLPTGITYDTDRNRYVVNEKPFVIFKQSKWYLDYISKFGFSAATPTEVLLSLLLVDSTQLIAHPLEIGSMFIDRAGTTPVTEPGQQVGQVLDAGGGNFHATAVSDAARGFFAVEPETGRRNLLTFTEEFDNTAWQKQQSLVVPNQVTAPNGELTADAIADSDNLNGPHRINRSFANYVSGLSYTYAVFVRPENIGFFQLSISSTRFGGVAASAFFNLSTGTVVSSTSQVTATITTVANGFFRVSVTAVCTSSGSGVLRLSPSINGVSNEYLGVTDRISVYLWGAQLEIGNTATPYQRVRSQFDVTEAGVRSLRYVAYNGVNTAYQTPVLPAPGVDKAQVFAGVRKLSDAGTLLCELSPNAEFNVGAFYLVSGTDLGAQYLSLGRGNEGTSLLQIAKITGFFAPDTAVLTAIHDIPAPLSRLLRNGVAGTDSTADKGTGNFNPSGTYRLNIGSRNGTSAFFNGFHYGTLGPITRFGTNATADQIAAAEAYYTKETGL